MVNKNDKNRKKRIVKNENIAIFLARFAIIR